MHHFVQAYQHIEIGTKWKKLADDIFKCIFFIENVWISIKISLKFVPNGSITGNNIPALVPGWRQAIIWTNDG